MISTSLGLTLTVTLTFNNSQKFVIINLGSFPYFLDIQAHCNTNGLFICQTKYIQDILTKETMIDAKHCSSPTSTTKLDITSGDVLDNPTHYWSLVGALHYLIWTWLDIFSSINQVSQHTQTPQTFHLTAIKRILRYLKGTPDHDFPKALHLS